MNSLVGLPEELLRVILLRLSPEDIIKSCSANTNLYNICQDELFWEAIAANNWPDLRPHAYKPTWQELGIYLAQNSKLIPVYDNYNKVAVLRIYKDTKLYNLDITNKLGKTVYNIKSLSLYNKEGLPIIDSKQSKFFGFTSYSDDVETETRFLIRGEGFQALVDISPVKSYGDVTTFRSISGTAIQFPQFLALPENDTINIQWSDISLPRPWDLTLSQIYFFDIVDGSINKKISQSITLYDVISAVIVNTALLSTS